MLNAAYHYLDLVPKGRDETLWNSRSPGCASTTDTSSDALPQGGVLTYR